jgi:hypothetical protein
MKKINIDETVPANRGSCVSVVYPGTFDLAESKFHEETGPVNFTPNGDHSPNVFRQTSLLFHK